MWLREALTGLPNADSSGESLRLLCGPMLPRLPYLRQLLGGQLAVRRATLLSGEVAVGLLLPRNKVAAMLHEAPQAMSGVDMINGTAITENVVEGQQRWFLELDRALVTQRALQQALPAHDDHADWRQCWALLRHHESSDLDTDELQEAQQKQADIRSFQLEMQRRKKLVRNARPLPFEPAWLSESPPLILAA